MIFLCNRVRELSIIKISVESRALLSFYVKAQGLGYLAMILREKKKKGEEIKRNKEIILILWRVMTSHIKSMMNKSC